MSADHAAEASTASPVLEPAEPQWRARIRGSKLGNVVVLLVTALAVALGAWLVNDPATGESTGTGGVTRVEVTDAAASPRVGEAAASFVATALDGEEVSLEALGGRPVWLLFVATWCAGCRAEMPDVQAVHDGAGADGPVIVAIYVGESASSVRRYSQRLGLGFTQVPDPQTRIAAAYGVLGVPAHFFIDASGIIRQAQVGVLSPTQMDQALAAAS